MAEELALGIIVAAALADSINPCVFGVLIFLLAYMTKVFKSSRRMLLAAGIYITAVYVTYFLLGMGILTLAYTAGLAKPFYRLAATIAILAGLLEIKDYFWYGRWFSLQMLPGTSERIKHYSKTMEKLETNHPALSLLIAALLGVFVVFVELPCTGAPYLAILGLVAAGQYAEAIPLLLLYNLIFILPLFVIVGIVYFGRTTKNLEKWRKENRGLMRLGIGLFLLALGTYMWWAVI
ncbi:MAG TPA: cytochrome c biogenesis protein CcdA [archaeon]|nr:cytochrome c biogenesis protein CcdA [archaeon]